MWRIPRVWPSADAEAPAEEPVLRDKDPRDNKDSKDKKA
jgi:hypothetical protein